MSSRIRRVLLAITALALNLGFITVARAHFCTAAVCQLCCKATQEGCVNAFTSYASGTLISNNLYCEQCNCDNPQIGRKDASVMCMTDAGCGWVGRRFKRIECTSCAIIDAMLENNPDLPVAGCGRAVVDGALIFTS
ncbi:hypothetical protein BBBOND_0100110 [Babesia bigemina]|uniref:Uncharacterized protein n=1 Tax=Babesia bigemina TaxID=5866 RepID=A0A061D0K7_BABBI|nr:hypothetical protein BBBOND_0100110 [Babesia bigemina]CDR93682.1 hypothetical protein BBBOND_0100110 [Babesia bigemina]|eukprot:XP_012765868.1 hypothetical protein BBBOND_0100110 [Babesia bigemina]